MRVNCIDQIGDWNPQLLRELKGHLKPRNVIIAAVVSVVGQVLLLLSFVNQLSSIYVDSKYCYLRANYEQYITQYEQINKQINSLYSNYEKNKKVINELGKKASEISTILNKKCPEDAINMQLWWQDLVFGEKSPAQVAIGINLLIFTAILLPWLLVLPKDTIPSSEEQLKGILAIGFFFSIIMIYASLAQLMLMMKNDKRSLYTTATIIAAIALPPTILSVLRIDPAANPIPWLLSTFPWRGMQTASVTTIFLAFLGELSILALINLRLTRQLQQAGESTTKALLVGRN